MAVFRRVEASQAGPQALGILVAPGQRTMVIVRPRSLAWDLLPARPLWPTHPRPAFLELPREEATATAQKLADVLEAAVGGEGRVASVPAADAAGFWLAVELGPLYLLACRRAPGQPYQPLLLASRDEAEQAVQLTARILFPQGGAEQELYLNLRHFAR
jgi:hypothetical protein